FTDTCDISLLLASTEKFFMAALFMFILPNNIFYKTVPENLVSLRAKMNGTPVFKNIQKQNLSNI
ncbi:MAG TPA: hypothetical protein PL110_10685, partial [Candidatus Eremiobacteraeota bacterium]|nr:hypothetical protein [Candidatus Eremiobacteraeota bacterium]